MVAFCSTRIIYFGAEHQLASEVNEPELKCFYYDVCGWASKQMHVYTSLINKSEFVLRNILSSLISFRKAAGNPRFNY